MKKLTFLNLLLLVAVVAPSSLIAAPKQKTNTRPIHASRLERALDFAKKVYTLEYLNGENGEYRRSSLFDKIRQQPGRAFLTAAVYGTSLYAIKLLCDVADNQGFWANLKDHAQAVRQERDLHDYQDRQRERYQQDLQDRQQDTQLTGPNDALPFDRIGRNRIPIANPMPGHQLQIHGIPHFQGFFHMQSETPYHHLHDGCGVNAAYNMALVEAHLHNRHVDQQNFDRILNQEFPQAGQRGASNDEVTRIAQRMNFVPVMVLSCNARGEIHPVGRTVYFDANARAQERQEAFIDAARQDMIQAAREFRRGNGIQVAHFLCGIPGHWVYIAVTRNAQNQQAMYLFDNLNNRPHAVEQMRRHIDNIYNHFFNA